MLLFNLILTGEKYPSYFKKCIIIPIQKSSNKLNCSNYRPISLSISLSKIFEKFMKIKISDFLNSNSYFLKINLVFNKGSINNANFFINKYINETLDLINKVMGIFLYVKKADSINQELLLKKLNFAGIRGTENNFIRLYLTDKLQIVKY